MGFTARRILCNYYTVFFRVNKLKSYDQVQFCGLISTQLIEITDDHIYIYQTNTAVQWQEFNHQNVTQTSDQHHIVVYAIPPHSLPCSRNVRKIKKPPYIIHME